MNEQAAENPALREALDRVPSCVWHGHGAYPESCWWCALNRVIPPEESAPSGEPA